MGFGLKWAKQVGTKGSSPVKRNILWFYAFCARPALTLGIARQFPGNYNRKGKKKILAALSKMHPTHFLTVLPLFFSKEMYKYVFSISFCFHMSS